MGNCLTRKCARSIRLLRSEVARHEVEALARTFELLDVLPSMNASEDFASKTLTNLKVTEEPFQLADQWWFRSASRVGIAAGWLVSLMACGWVGFQLTTRWIPNPSEDVLRELPLIENLDQYQDIGEFDFLNQLKRQGLFDDVAEK